MRPTPGAPATIPARRDDRRFPGRPCGEPNAAAGAQSPWMQAVMADRGAHPVKWLRGLALSLERLAAQGVMGGAVRGAADELRSGMPDNLDGQVRALLQEGLTVLEQLMAEAARSRDSPLGTWSRTTAEGAVRGAVEEFRRLVPEMQPTTQELLGRVKQFLDRSAAEAEERAQVIHAPGDRVRIAAAGAVVGATEQLGVVLPQLAAPAAEFAARVGRGFVQGSTEEVGRQVRLAGRSPLARAVLVGGAIVAAVLLAVRRR